MKRRFLGAMGVALSGLAAALLMIGRWTDKGVSRPCAAVSSSNLGTNGPETVRGAMDILVAHPSLRNAFVATDGGGDSPDVRKQALRIMDGHPTRPEVEAAYKYLFGRRTLAELTPLLMHAEKNNLMDRLQSVEEARRDLTGALIGLYRDRGLDVVVRDYAVQHFVSWYPSAPDKDVLRAALWEATEENKTSVGGTALLGLLHLSRDNSEVDRHAIAERALQLAGDEQCGELTRITAVQVCGQLNLLAAAPIAGRLALDSESVALRIAAIAALGQLGQAETPALLERLATDVNPRISAAARSARDRFRKRLEEDGA